MIYVGVITILVLIAGLGWSVLKLVDNELHPVPKTPS
jgi:hypothetical protein